MDTSALLLIPCPTCGVTNRVPQANIDQKRTPVCGRCKTPLRASSTPITKSAEKPRHSCRRAI